MIKYATYNYYKDVYGGELTQDEFDRNCIKASAFIRSMIGGKLETDDYDLDDYEEVKYAVCEMADAIKEVKNSKGKEDDNGNIIKQVSNDGYSVSYVSGEDHGHTEEQTEKNRMLGIARTYLTETGLLSRCVYPARW